MSDAVKPDIIGLTSSIITWLIKQFKDMGVQEVIKATHLQNKEKERPVLIKKHPTETGFDYIFSMPAGVVKEDFEKYRTHFEAYTNSVIEIESKGRRLTLKSHTREFSKDIKFTFDPSDYKED